MATGSSKGQFVKDEVSRRFHVIKRPFSKQGARLKWAEGTEDGGWVSKSADDPHACTQDFIDAFDALAPFIDGQLGLTKAQQKGRVVLGVDFKYNKEGEESVYISATLPVEGYQPVNLMLGKFTPAGDLEKALTTLALCANRYLEGEKLQLELPSESSDESDSEQQADLLED
jgi:hypothetical protein